MTARSWLILSLIALSLPACSGSGDGLSGDDVAVSVTYKTPRELIEEMTRLQSGVCSFRCQMAIAGMYSTEFLKGQRDAVMYGISNKETRREMSLAFFGAEIPLDEIEAMTDQEFFARQLLHRERTVPADVIMRNVEIVGEEFVDEREVRMVVVRSGLEADPDYEEEGVMNFVLEQDVWKIKN